MPPAEDEPAWLNRQGGSVSSLRHEMRNYEQNRRFFEGEVKTTLKQQEQMLPMLVAQAKELGRLDQIVDVLRRDLVECRRALEEKDRNKAAIIIAWIGVCGALANAAVIAWKGG